MEINKIEIKTKIKINTIKIHRNEIKIKTNKYNKTSQ